MAKKNEKADVKETVAENMSEKDLYKLDQVSIRLVKEPPLLSEEMITSPWSAARLISNLMKDLDREMLCLVNLKTNHQPINMNIVSIGTLNATLFHPREVMKSAVLSNAESMILFHCHPSGNLKPSKEDIRITDQISKIGDLMEIPLLDHIIIGNGEDCFSFKLNNIFPLSHLEFAETVEDLQFRKGERFELDKPEKAANTGRKGRKAGVKEQEASYSSLNRFYEPNGNKQRNRETAASKNSRNPERNKPALYPEKLEESLSDQKRENGEKVNPLRFIEEVEEDNTNMIDGVLNNMSLKEKKTDGERTEIQMADERSGERTQKSDKTERTAEESKPKGTEKEKKTLKERLQEKIKVATEKNGAGKEHKLIQKKCQEVL